MQLESTDHCLHIVIVPRGLVILSLPEVIRPYIVLAANPCNRHFVQLAVTPRDIMCTHFFEYLYTLKLHSIVKVISMNGKLLFNWFLNKNHFTADAGAGKGIRARFHSPFNLAVLQSTVKASFFLWSNFLRECIFLLYIHVKTLQFTLNNTIELKLIFHEVGDVKFVSFHIFERTKALRIELGFFSRLHEIYYHCQVYQTMTRRIFCTWIRTGCHNTPISTIFAKAECTVIWEPTFPSLKHTLNHSKTAEELIFAYWSCWPWYLS